MGDWSPGLRAVWAQLTCALAGVWLMASPSLLGYGRPMATSDWIVGPLVASFGLIASWEVTRALRWVNVVLAAWLVLSPFVLGSGASGAVVANHLGCGLLVGLLSLARGRPEHPFAGGWKSLRKRKLAG